MKRNIIHALVGSALVIAAPLSVASAADMPVKAPPALVYKAAPVAVSGGWYAFLDGMYDRVRLPGYNLGFAGIQAGAPFGETASFNQFSPSLDGGGVRGGVGYIVPGSRWRLEAAGSYVRASGTTAQGFATAVGGAYTPLLNGTAGGFGFNCSSGFGLTCSGSGALSTSYSSWQAYGKAAYDTPILGTGMVSPFVAVFGGNSHNNQSFAQTLSQFLGGALTNTGTYGANTALHWNDIGARAGIDSTVPVNSWLSWSFAGWVGIAARDVSLNGTDVAASTLGMAGVSALSTSATTTAFIANAETGFSVKVTPATTLRGFVGVNFDDRVPGITAPTWTSLTGFAELGATPAAIRYSSETSYYTGGGVTVKF